MTTAQRGAGPERRLPRLVRLAGPDGPGLSGAAEAAPGPPLPLDREQPFRIGRDPTCSLSLPQESGLSRQHAELRADAAGGWWLEDLGSRNGTFLEGERLQAACRLRDGDRFRLGGRGPLLQFLEGEQALVGEAERALDPPARSAPPTPPSRSAPSAPSATPPARSAPPPAHSAPPAQAPASAAPSLAGTVAVAGRQLPLEQIRTVELRSEAAHPQLFSWWVLGCLGGLLLLPFPWLFWPWQLGALGLALALARRRDHTLIVTLRDGRAHRHRFRDGATAAAHHRGLRRALGLPSP